jgi:hypothetical protein
VLDEIAGSPTELARAALESLEVGLIALGRADHVEDVADRLASLGTTADRYAIYASVLGGQGFPDLALAYLRLAARRGFADVAAIDADEHLADARGRPRFEPIREDVLDNARRADRPVDPTRAGRGASGEAPGAGRGSGDREALDGR